MPWEVPTRPGDEYEIENGPGTASIPNPLNVATPPTALTENDG